MIRSSSVPRERLPRRLKHPGSAPALTVVLLPSCSSVLQSLHFADLASHRFDATRLGLACAGPRGRVCDLTRRGETTHHPLLHSPSRPESSLDAMCADRFSRIAALAFLESLRPFDVSAAAATSLPHSTCVSCFQLHQVCLAWLCNVLEVSHLLDALLRICFSGLVSCQYRPWAFIPPKVSPQP